MNSLKAAVFGSSQKVPIFAKRCFYLNAALCDQTKDPSLYDVLQIPQNSTHTEIRDSYYKLSKMYHPDVKQDENSSAMFRKITEAYDVLGNVRTRLEYDNKFLGKYQPYDTSKQEFYASLYRDQCLDGVRRPDTDTVMKNRSLIDDFMDREYKDRVAEYRMYKNKLYEHYRVDDALGGPFGWNRAMFCGIVVGCWSLVKFQEAYGDMWSSW